MACSSIWPTISEIRAQARNRARIDELEAALAEIARKQIMDAVAAMQMRAIARAVLELPQRMGGDRSQ